MDEDFDPSDTEPAHDGCEMCGDGVYGHPIPLERVWLGRDDRGESIGDCRACKECAATQRARNAEVQNRRFVVELNDTYVVVDRGLRKRGRDIVGDWGYNGPAAHRAAEALNGKCKECGRMRGEHGYGPGDGGGCPGDGTVIRP